MIIDQKLFNQLVARPTCSQEQAAKIIGLNQSTISRLVKKEKIEAEDKKRPYLDALAKYETHPEKKRKKKK